MRKLLVKTILFKRWRNTHLPRSTNASMTAALEVLVKKLPIHSQLKQTCDKLFIPVRSWSADEALINVLGNCFCFTFYFIYNQELVYF